MNKKEQNENEKEKDDQKHKFSFHHHHHHHETSANQLHDLLKNKTDATVSKENLASVLHSLTSLRRMQESSLKSVSEENFASSSSSCAKKTFETMATASSSSTKNETTGGEDKKESSMMETGACPIEKTMFTQQQQQQQQQTQKQQSSIVTSSSSSSIASSTETIKKTKTLSFLHNEDLFSTGTMISDRNSSSNSLYNYNDDKWLPTASHLFRSISFHERRQNQKSTLQRTESGKEGSTATGDFSRKMAILSPKHSLQELNDRIKQQQMRMQQQMYYGSSELSM